jgi:hypothetical protein
MPELLTHATNCIDTKVPEGSLTAGDAMEVSVTVIGDCSMCSALLGMLQKVLQCESCKVLEADVLNRELLTR